MISGRCRNGWTMAQIRRRREETWRRVVGRGERVRPGEGGGRRGELVWVGR